MAPDPTAPLALLPTLPQELQDRIFEMCDLSSLAVLCRLNLAWYKKTAPFLWGEIDCVREVSHEDQVDYSRKFLSVCHAVMDETPERWAILASFVRKLNLGRLQGINIIRDGEWDGFDDYIFYDEYATEEISKNIRKNVFDMIAQFPNLETLSVYIKNCWCTSTQLEASGEALAKGLMKLKTLKIGGQMVTGIILGLLARPENIEHLSLINLIESPGQDNGPEAIAFLSDIHDRFKSLKSLHLCKLADLDGYLSVEDEDVDGDGSQIYASGMPWRFPRESEVVLLEDWASLLHQSKKTLAELTLENRYLCGTENRDWKNVVISPGVSHPAEYGANSIRESQRFLFPVLSEGEWPKLRKLTLIGMGGIEEVTKCVSHLEPRVQIEQLFAGTQEMAGDVTPQQISTPRNFTEAYFEQELLAK